MLERRELAALARVLTVSVRDTMAAELRVLRESVQEVKVYVDQRLKEIAAVPPVKGDPGRDAEVDYHIIGAQIQSEVDRRINESLKAAIAEIPIINGVDGRDADPELVRSLVESQVRDAVAAIPAPRDGLPGKDGRDAEPVDIDSVVLKVLSAIPTPKDGQPGPRGEPGLAGRDGIDGKDGVPGPEGKQGTQGERGADGAIGPQGERGIDGKDAEPINLEAFREMVIAEATRAVAAIPPPRDGIDGKDAPAVDIENLITEVTKRIPVPKDGRSIEPQEVRAMVSEEVKLAVAQIPPAKDGKDGESIHPDTVRLMIVQEAKKAVSELPPPRDGRDGNDGRSSLSLDVLPTIDPAKSYPRGTEAHYRGGTIKALRTTDPVGDGSLEQAGWSIVADGIDFDNARAVQGDDDLRVFRFELPFTSGRKLALTADMPIPLFHPEFIWRAGQHYSKADMVQRNGSIWFCLKEGTKAQPGTSDADWRLVVKKSADGTAGPRGEQGPEGRAGRDGRDLTQVDGTGRKW